MNPPHHDAVAQVRVERALRESNATLEDQVRSRTAMIEMLHDIASHVHEAQSLEEAVQFVLRRVAECNGWSFGQAYSAPSDDPDRLIPLEAHYHEPGGPFGDFRQRIRDVSLHRGEGLPGRTLETGEPVWATSLPDDLRSARGVPGDALPIKAAAAFPVIVGDRVELVLEFFGMQPQSDQPRILQGMTSVCVHLARTIERLQADAVLRESEQRFRELAETISQVFWVLDPATDTMLYVSPQWSRIVDVPASENDSETPPWRSYIHPHDRQRVCDEFARCTTSQRVDVMYRVVRTDGGIRWIHDVALPLHDESGNLRRVLGVAEDVTERRELEREIADAATHEQQRLSRDLHDSIGQELTGLTMMADRLARSLEATSPADAEAAAGLVAGLKRTLQQVRRISRGLAPVDIEAGGLTVALAQLAEQTRLMATTECIFRCEDPVTLRDPGVANHLYRIAQEAVANAIKHARARTIKITLKTDECFCRLIIEDDGRGRESEQRGSDEGMGLRIMRYRANLIGAHFRVAAPPSGGTRITCRIRLDGQHRPPP